MTTSIFEQAKELGIKLSLIPQSLGDISEWTVEQWEKKRNVGIGGSDAGKIMGTNTYDSDLEKLAKEKLGLLPKQIVDYKTQARFDAGHAMEPVTLKLFGAITGFKTFTDTNMYQHEAYPFMTANCDAFCINANGIKCGVELKYINPQNLWEWRSGVYGNPDTGYRVGNESYVTQCRHYMSVLNINTWYLVVWGGNIADDMRIIRVDRDMNIEADMIHKEQIFWSYVENGTWPQVDRHTDDGLKQLASIEVTADASKEKYVITDNILECEKVAEKLLKNREEQSLLNKQLKELKEEANAYKLSLITSLDNHLEGVIQTDDYDYEFSYKAPALSDKLDFQKLQMNYPEFCATLKEEKIITTEEKAKTFRIKKKKHK